MTLTTGRSAFKLFCATLALSATGAAWAQQEEPTEAAANDGDPRTGLAHGMSPARWPVLR